MSADGHDVRWRQRLGNYTMALGRLSEAVLLAAQRPLSPLEQQGLIQAFEFTHELAWSVLKDYFFWQGDSTITGSRDATRLAFARALISDGEGWMEMIKSRNQTSHTYNQAIAEAICALIISRYFQLFVDLEQRMRLIESGQ